ncbi:MAG: electron transfer flavoprotein subunit beta/FixA family protein [Heliobacteriaceae bacterium]|nr:electron transfer flavoprotein subunit beta/FixA family protein [Heliobacteriaceae bacterium]
MANIVVCYKWVLDEQDIKVNPGNLALDTSRAKSKISDYDRNAIEEAVLLNEKDGHKVTGLTFGVAGAKQSLKDALSRGPAEAVWVNDPVAAEADAFVTANVLAGALKKVGNYDVIICGEGAADTYAQQVGPRLAAVLGIPAITFVNQMSIEGDKVVATRKLGDCTETVTASFPVVVTVLPEINKPRIPSLKQVLGASKKPVTEIKLADLGLNPDDLKRKTTVKSLKGYAMTRKNVIYKDGSTAEKVAKLVAELAKEGAL